MVKQHENPQNKMQYLSGFSHDLVFPPQFFSFDEEEEGVGEEERTFQEPGVQPQASLWRSLEVCSSQSGIV